MKFGISVLKLAINDLKEIHDYLSGFGEDPPKKFKNSFEKFCSQFTNTPYMCNKYEHGQLYRKAVLVFDYLVFYRVDEQEGLIKVFRVLHGKRNVVPLVSKQKTE